MHEETQINDVVLRFDQVAEQQTGFITRVSGMIKLRHLIPLIDRANLDANPRSAKVGPVTEAIRDALQNTPETFPFKTKGILIGASSYAHPEAKRYELTFVNAGIEGILDGGHNTLAIGRFILELALGEDAIKKAKTWAEFKSLWAGSTEAVKAYRLGLTTDERELETLVPVELIVPSDPDDDIVVADFNKSLLDICAARNNNVQLKAAAKANQSGYFDDLKKQLPESVASRVEWKAGEGGAVKVEDIIGLAWIPLAALELDVKDEDGRKVEAPSGQQIYSSKGECINRFERLMSSPTVTSSNTDEYKRELKSLAVLSAFKIAGQLPELFDYIYSAFPSAYNAGGGKFGKIKAVEAANRGKKATKFLDKAVSVKYPDGFILPLVYGLKALMITDEAGNVQWRTEPKAFLDKHLQSIVVQYMTVLQFVNHDPQKVGKAGGSYTTAISAFENAYLRSNA
jgi:hypothetical protein